MSREEKHHGLEALHPGGGGRQALSREEQDIRVVPLDSIGVENRIADHEVHGPAESTKELD